MGGEQGKFLTRLQALDEVLGRHRNTVGLDGKSTEDQGITLCILGLLDRQQRDAVPPSASLMASAIFLVFPVLEW